MSLVQKPFVDYKQAGFGDLGTDSSSSIQPIMPGEPARDIIANRAPENLRGRTEIARDLLDDLLYYRDHGQYLLKSTGNLTWAGTVANGGTGIANNVATLTILPLLSQSNVKGTLTIGTAAVNAIVYAVAGSAYSTDGVNAVYVEHREVSGIVTPTCVITAGPVYRILVVFDSAVAAHDAPTIAPIVASALSGSDLNGFITASSNGVLGNVIDVQAEIGLNTRVHPSGTAGNGTLDAEEHTLAAGALSTFTTANPLVEGSVVAIRYDYLIEPVGGDADDPKGGTPGGRAESISGRGNTDVAANLFILESKPQWAAGAIPICKVVNGVLRFLDGTALAKDAAAPPGTGLGSTISGAGYAGVPTLVVGGGIATTVTTIPEALTSVDQRLGQLRAETWTLSDGTNSTGAHVNGAGAVQTAMAAAPGGGHLYLRAGTYTGITGAGGLTAGCLLEGEARERVSMGFTTTVASPIVIPNIQFKRITFTRTTTAALLLNGVSRVEDCIIPAGSVDFSSTSHPLTIENLLVTSSSVVGTLLSHGVQFGDTTLTALHVRNSSFTGPDTNSGLSGTSMRLQPRVQQALFENCTFTAVGARNAIRIDATVSPTVSRNYTFVNCRFTNGGDEYVVAFPPTDSSSLPVKIVFDNCYFSNTTNGKVADVQAGNNYEIEFRDCTFHQNNTDATATTRLIAAPNTNGIVRIVRSKVLIGQTMSTGSPGIPVVSLGGVTTAGSAGLTVVDGLLIQYATAVTDLQPDTNIILCQSTTATNVNSYANIDIDFGGHSVTTGGTGDQPTVKFINASATRPIEVGKLTLRNALASGQEKILYTTRCNIETLHIEAVTSTLSGGGLQFDAGTIVRGGSVPWYRGAATAIFVTGAGAEPTLLQNLRIVDMPSTHASVYGIFVTLHATLQNCKIRATSTSSPGGITLEAVSSLLGNEISLANGLATVIAVSAGSGFGCRIQGNHIVFDNATGSAAISGLSDASTSTTCTIGNLILNANATVPTLPSPPAGGVIANNVFAGSWAFG